jgi:hypothetical protein
MERPYRQLRHTRTVSDPCVPHKRDIAVRRSAVNLGDLTNFLSFRDRTMARKASATPPEGESQATESASGTITKAEAIRKTLAEGITKSEDGVAHIKKRYGLDVTKGHFAASKSKEKTPGETVQATPRRGRPPGKTKGVTVKVKRGRKPKAAVEGYLAPPPKGAAEPSGDLLAQMEALKPLVESMGKERAKRIIDLIG